MKISLHAYMPLVPDADPAFSKPEDASFSLAFYLFPFRFLRTWPRAEQKASTCANRSRHLLMMMEQGFPAVGDHARALPMLHAVPHRIVALLLHFSLIVRTYNMVVGNTPPLLFYPHLSWAAPPSAGHRRRHPPAGDLCPFLFLPGLPGALGTRRMTSARPINRLLCLCVYVSIIVYSISMSMSMSMSILCRVCSYVGKAEGVR